nr:hypothetical protein Itr_chr07CG05660 [Ipomoea trifida]
MPYPKSTQVQTTILAGWEINAVQGGATPADHAMAKGSRRALVPTERWLTVGNPTPTTTTSFEAHCLHQPYRGRERSVSPHSGQALANHGQSPPRGNSNQPSLFYQFIQRHRSSEPPYFPPF